MNKYFLYARKSTDVEDKQVLSIEAQITELRAYARSEKLEIVEELIEKQSAKVPGRPIFNEMLSRIENGEANVQLVVSYNQRAHGEVVVCLTNGLAQNGPRFGNRHRFHVDD